MVEDKRNMIYEGSRIKTVWFDLDDTLIDFRTNSRAALRIVYDSVEPIRLLFADAEAWTERYEFHNHLLWDQYSRAEIDRDTLRMERFRLPLAEAGMTDAEARRLSEFLDTYYLDRLAEQKNLIPGAIELIDAIKNRWPDIRIGVLSNGFADVQHRKIRNAGLQDKIDLTVLSDDIDVNKPDRRLFEHAARMAASEQPDSNLLIGDNPTTDIAGALGAGWHAVWFDRTGDAPAPDDPRCARATALATILPLLLTE